MFTYLKIFPERTVQRGFTLIELVLVVVIIGLLAAVAAKQGAHLFETAEVEQTRREMDELAFAIVGNPDLHNNGTRTDFGYVGDVGSLPPNLEALHSNPGGYTTWRGPYITNRLAQSVNDFKTDAWGIEYAYNGGGGVTITSVGHTPSIVRQVTASATEILRNNVSGILYDADGTPPGDIYNDSLTVALTVPNGVGGTVVRTVRPDAGGYFYFDSVPIGNRSLDAVFSAAHDSVSRVVSVIPGSNVYCEFRLAADYWHASTSLPGLVGHYTLNEDSGLVAYDYSGRAIDADLRNDALGAGWSTGKIGGAFEFDGVDDHFETPVTSAELQISGDYSISVWIRPDPSQVTWAAIVSRCTPTGNDNLWTLQWDDQSGTTKRLTVYHPGGGNWRSSYTLAQAMSNWHHIVITFRASPPLVRLYVDNVFHSESTSLTQLPGSGNGKLRIGSDRTTYRWHGKIDDLRIYDRVLTISEIQTLYEMGN